MPYKPDTFSSIYLEIEIIESRKFGGGFSVADILRQMENYILKSVMALFNLKAHRDIVKLYYRFFHHIISANPGSIFLKIARPRKNIATLEIRSVTYISG